MINLSIVFGTVSNAITNGTYFVDSITSDEARNMVKQYHYSGKAVPNSQIHLGIFNTDGLLVGCLQYGPPMNGDKTSCKFSDSVNMMELNRMVMADSEPRNAESMAISLCNKWLKRNTELDYILSFSDGKQGNCGYIYQASNWKYLGYILSDSFYEVDGDIRHAVTIWHQFKEFHPLRDTHTTDEILCKTFKNVSRIICKQHIYVYSLKKKVKFNFSERPFPKKDKEIPIIGRRWINREGVACKDVEMYTEEQLSPCF